MTDTLARPPVMTKSAGSKPPPHDDRTPPPRVSHRGGKERTRKKHRDRPRNPLHDARTLRAALQAIVISHDRMMVAPDEYTYDTASATFGGAMVAARDLLEWEPPRAIDLDPTVTPPWEE